MGIVSAIQAAVSKELNELYQAGVATAAIPVNETKPEFEGDYTVVLFAFVKTVKRSPEVLGKELGDKLVAGHPQLFGKFNVIKGFLNLSISDRYWLQFLQTQHVNERWGLQPASGRRVMVEYSSPNTNKPLHLGHLRNNFLGWSIAEILKANGHEVIKTCIVNDRGVHICKSMLAWKKFGHGATPQSTGIKGDHLVGDYYVAFENELREQSAPLLQQVWAGNTSALSDEDQRKAHLLLARLPSLAGNEEKTKELEDELKEMARNNTPIMQEVRDMLLLWEKGDAATMELWQQMNTWVYEGFDATYKRIGSDFDKIYYESRTYLLGKQFVERGLQQGIFTRREDGSVWIDLTADGLDEKLLLRRDGTSVYITQDIGLAKQKSDDFRMDQSIYVIADEQNYHMKVLKLICEKLQIPHAGGIYHLSYGMVELPAGRMKSREGTVVDADDLADEMVREAAAKTKEQGKTEGFSETELQELCDMIGLGGLKFFLLRVDPKNRIIFNPEESIDLHGFTATFVQYAHARIRSILRKEQPQGQPAGSGLLPMEKQLIIQLEQFPQIITQGAAEMNPSVVAIYIYQLARLFNSFYNDPEHSVINAKTADKKELRLQLCLLTASVVRTGMQLLGIRVPDRM